MLLPNIQDEINTKIMNQNNHFPDIYYWFQNEKLTTEMKSKIKNKIMNNTLPLREKVLLAPTSSIHIKPDPKQIELNTKKINFAGEKDVFSKYLKYNHNFFFLSTFFQFLLKKFKKVSFQIVFNCLFKTWKTR